MRRLFVMLAFAPAIALAPRNAANADWPVYQGNSDHTHYTTLSQITPANVAKLKVAWEYDTKDAFAGSEMQSNPIIVDGVMYAMSPKQRGGKNDAPSGGKYVAFALP
jgi:quinoprotein glucose dehydrogenase